MFFLVQAELGRSVWRAIKQVIVVVTACTSNPTDVICSSQVTQPSLPKLSPLTWHYLLLPRSHSQIYLCHHRWHWHYLCYQKSPNSGFLQFLLKPNSPTFPVHYTIFPSIFISVMKARSNFLHRDKLSMQILPSQTIAYSDF